MIPIQLSRSERYLVRHVILDGEERGLSVVEVKDGCVSVAPFEREVHSTVLLDGSLVMETENGKIKKIWQNV